MQRTCGYRRALLVLSAAGLAGCVGGIGTSGEETPGGEPAGRTPAGGKPGAPTGNAPTGSAPGAPAPGTMGTPAATVCKGTPAVGPSLLLRLSRDEYDNTVRDLLRDASRPARAFLADEKAGPFDANGTIPVTDAMLEQYQAAAEGLAAAAVKSLATLVPCAAMGPTDACAESFVRDFGRRAYRRPLGADEVMRYMALYRTGQGQAATADAMAEGIRLVVAGMLQSPHFLYRVETGLPAQPGAKVAVLAPHELAARLSYFLWDTMPDAALMKAVDEGTLGTPEQIEREVRRMLAAPQASAGVSGFLVQLLRLDELEDVQKDAKVFAGFTPELRAAMRAETARFADFVVREGDGKLETLLGSRVAFLQGPLFAIYGVRDPGGTGLKKVDLDPAQRSGFLTQAGLMAALAHVDQTSPVHRGVFVREDLLCQELPSPPDNANVTPPQFDPQQSTRQRFTAHRADPACAGCHSLIDPLGFGFENYDLVGRHRTTEGRFPVDATGEVLGGTTDIEGPFTGAIELGRNLARSAIAQRCFTRQWVRYALSRPDASDDACSIESAHQAFAAGGHDVRELIVSVAKSDSFRHKRVTP